MFSKLKWLVTTWARFYIIAHFINVLVLKVSGNDIHASEYNVDTWYHATFCLHNSTGHFWEKRKWQVSFYQSTFEIEKLRKDVENPPAHSRPCLAQGMMGDMKWRSFFSANFLWLVRHVSFKKTSPAPRILLIMSFTEWSVTTDF